MNVKNVASMSVVLMVLSIATHALADNCKDPKVEVVNDRSAAIKVAKFQYFDSCDGKWRTEDVSNVEIEAGKSHTFTDDLGYVGNCKITKFKFYRALRQSTGSGYSSYEWGGELTPDGGAKTCNTGVKFTVHVHE